MMSIKYFFFKKKLPNNEKLDEKNCDFDCSKIKFNRFWYIKKYRKIYAFLRIVYFLIFCLFNLELVDLIAVIILLFLIFFYKLI